MYLRKKSGFTIIELAVVIVVIGILAAITIVSFNQMKARAQAAAISDGLQKVDKSMRIWGTFKNFVSWPIDPVGDGGIALVDLAASDPTLESVLNDIPEVDGVHTEDWFYDNEGDAKDNCTFPYDGVNIVVRYVTDVSVARQVDEAIDDGDFTCGKVRYIDERIFYALSNTQKF